VEETSTHGNGEHTSDRMYSDIDSERVEWMKVYSNIISVVEGSGVVNGRGCSFFETLRLTMKIVHNLLVGQRCGDIRSLECLGIGKSPRSGCGDNSRATEILPADRYCYTGSRNPQEKDWFENAW